MRQRRLLVICLLAGLAIPQDSRPPAPVDQGTVELTLESRLFYEARLLEVVDRDQEAAIERYRRIAAEPGPRGSLLRQLARVRLAELARDRADPRLLGQMIEDLALEPPQRQQLRDALQSASWRAFQAAAEEVRAAATQVREAVDPAGEEQARQRLIKARGTLRAELAEGRRNPQFSQLFGANNALARLADSLRFSDRRIADLLEEQDSKSQRLGELLRNKQGSTPEALELAAQLRTLQRELGQARPRAIRPVSLAHRKVRDQQLLRFQAFLQGDLERARFHQREVERARRGTGVSGTLPANPTRDEKSELIDQFVAHIEAGLKAAPGDSPPPEALRQRVQQDLDQLKRMVEVDEISQAYQHLVREMWGPLEVASARALGTRR